MARKIRLDSPGIAAMLQSGEVTAAITELGEDVASRVYETASGEVIPVETRLRIAQGGGLSPRPAIDVSLAHPAGLAVEAKRGSLVAAAGAAGLEVKAR